MATPPWKCPISSKAVGSKSTSGPQMQAWGERTIFILCGLGINDDTWRFEGRCELGGGDAGRESKEINFLGRKQRNWAKKWASPGKEHGHSAPGPLGWVQACPWGSFITPFSPCLCPSASKRKNKYLPPSFRRYKLLLCLTQCWDPIC